MKFLKEFAGKWVAIKEEKIVESSENLKTLMQKVESRKDHAVLRYSLVPKRCIALTSPSAGSAI